MSYIYVICEKDQSPVKIGFSHNPEGRLKQLQTGHPSVLTLHFKEEIDDSLVKVLERIIHKENRHHRLSGEWFKLTPDEATSEIKHAIIRYGDVENLSVRFKAKNID